MPLRRPSDDYHPLTFHSFFANYTSNCMRSQLRFDYSWSEKRKGKVVGYSFFPLKFSCFFFAKWTSNIGHPNSTKGILEKLFVPKPNSWAILSIRHFFRDTTVIYLLVLNSITSSMLWLAVKVIKCQKVKVRGKVKISINLMGSFRDFSKI